jgi:hypothetical protein
MFICAHPKDLQGLKKCVFIEPKEQSMQWGLLLKM